ncbi:hypothetical protein K501DRAFT_284585 [Backusella circina FSU 941]|nr:hypothetical protein K501DRAFT_284585 [Backusella circina FSU 941]
MADDFDDELYNVYNGIKEESFENTELYDDKEEEELEQGNNELETVDEKKPSPEPQQPSSQMGNTNWYQQSNPLQQYAAAFQQNLQHMVMNSYQMQQMAQMPGGPSYPGYSTSFDAHNEGGGKPSVSSAANHDEG